MADNKEPRPKSALAPRLSLWDTISLIIGIVIGSAIFVVPAFVRSQAGDPVTTLLAWLLGGVLALVGAACYAELATANPGSGGDYIYLTKAFGRLYGFLFGWVHLTGVLTGSIAALGWVCGKYAGELLGQTGYNAPLACVAVIAVTALNLFGLVAGKWTQNLLTIAKLFGLAAIVYAGFAGDRPGWPELQQSWQQWTGTAASSPIANAGSFGVAMVLVMYAFGGWNDAAFVAAEVREPRRNLPRALLWGISAITLIYLLINLAFLCGLDKESLANTEAPVAALLQNTVGTRGFQMMCVVIVISALGSINGLVLTGSRVHARLGADHRLFRLLGRWQSKSQAPRFAILAQATVAILMILGVGTIRGQQLINQGFSTLRLPVLNWERFGDGFETLVAATAPVFWLFFLLTGHALFVLRHRTSETDAARNAFRVPGYPLTPMLFCVICTWMLFRSISWAGSLTFLSLGMLLIGVVVYALSECFTNREPSTPHTDPATPDVPRTSE